jgi:hypothetical protein
MNRRLKELAADAGYPDYMTYGQDKVLEKFAELIIQECAGICDHQGRAGWNDDRKAQARLDRDLIKQHFGVEE